MNKSLILFTFLFFFIISGCSSGLQYRFDFDEHNDFGKYKTYNFLKDEDSTGVSALDRESIQFIEDEIANHILDLGMFQRLDKPDLIIYYEVTITGKKRSSAFSEKNKDIFGEGYSYATSDPMAYDNREGSLSIYFYDLEKRQTVWKGSAFTKINVSREENKPIVAEAINHLFEEYPGF